MATVPRTVICRHCGYERRLLGRGLCASCYRNPEIRQLFSKVSTHNKPETEILYEPSHDEVEATIASQMQCLPSWWNDECARLRQQEDTEIADWFLVRLLRNANEMKRARAR